LTNTLEKALFVAKCADPNLVQVILAKIQEDVPRDSMILKASREVAQTRSTQPMNHSLN